MAAIDPAPRALLVGPASMAAWSAARGAGLRPPAAATAAPTPPAPSSGDPLALPHLPLGIDLDHLAIGRIQLAPPVIGEAVGLSVDGQAGLHAQRAEAQLTIQRVHGAAGHVELRLDYAG